MLYPSASVEGARPALGLLWGADVLEMVRGWGRALLSSMDHTVIWSSFLRKRQKTGTHVTTDNYRLRWGQVGFCVVGPGPAPRMEVTEPPAT